MKQNAKSTVTDFLQHGICEYGCLESGLIQSHLINDPVEQGYTITKNISGLMDFNKHTKYVCWCMLSSETNSNFTFENELSSCNLFSLNLPRTITVY